MLFMCVGAFLVSLKHDNSDTNHDAHSVPGRILCLGGVDENPILEGGVAIFRNFKSLINMLNLLLRLQSEILI